MRCREGLRPCYQSPTFSRHHHLLFSFSQRGSLMNNLTKRIELLANIAIIVVAVLLGGVLVKRYLLPQAPSPQAQARIQPGAKLSVPGIEWEKNERTLLLVLSTTCHFCTESSPFYQRLAQEKAKKGGVGLIAVLPQGVGDSQKYLNDLGVPVDDIKQAGLDAVQARGTPTLIMADRTGAVVESWVGKLPAEAEAEVLDRFLGGRPEE